MKLSVTPSSPLRGMFSLPGDKSISHRAALFAALAVGKSHIENFLVAGVTQVLLNGLAVLGIDWQLDESSLTVTGRGMHGFIPPSFPIDCGNSATTMRLLAGAISASGIPVILEGSASLRNRPMDRIIEPLQQMGVQIHSRNGCAPLSIKASLGELEGMTHTLSVASAQVKSCILLAGLAGSTSTIVREPGPSRDHTERLLLSMGVDVQSRNIIRKGRKYVETVLNPFSSLPLRSLQMTIPGDISSAAFLIVGALITPGSELIIKGVGCNPTRTGILDALIAMGADIRIGENQSQAGEPSVDIFVRYSSLQGIRVEGDMIVRMIDEFPIFAVAAAYANGVSQVCQAQELRIKESDRIRSVCIELANLGVDITERPDGFYIQGGRGVRGGRVKTHQDHRLAMALTIAGLAADNQVEVEGAEIISESFPEFMEYLKSLGGQIIIENED